METKAARRLIRFHFGSYRRVDYHCKLCPENNRASFGDPDRQPPIRKEIRAWLNGIAAHMLIRHREHPDVVKANAKPDATLINDFLVAIYS